MWQAEVLQRQGSWVTKHETKEAALEWLTNRHNVELNSTNPVLRVTMEDLSEREELPPTNPPSLGFDESWKP